jgi:hypothetical protein
LSYRARDRLSDLGGARVSANIPRARSRHEHGFNSSYNRLGRVGMTEMFEHHRRRPNLTDGIGNFLSGNVGR